MRSRSAAAASVVFVVVVGAGASCGFAEEGAEDAAEEDAADVEVVVAADVVAVAGDVAVGQDLFVHAWVPHDERSHGGDGLGPRENAASCVACHNAGGVGGAGAANVLTEAGTRRNTPSLFGAGLIDGIPDEVIEENARRKSGEASHVDDVTVDAVEAAQQLGRRGFFVPASGPTRALGGRVGRTPEGFVTRFGWKGDVRDLQSFVTQACANELGLEVPGAHQPLDSAPLHVGGIAGLFGGVGFEEALGNTEGIHLQAAVELVEPVIPAELGYDLDLAELVSLTSFAASLPRPVEVDVGRAGDLGRVVFDAIGCNECHQRQLGDVDGLYSDLLLHDMGRGLSDRSGAYGAPAANENANLWRTPPLWGVAVSAPYLHDGRAPDLDHAIRRHDGEGTQSRDAYANLEAEERAALLAFLGSLQGPTPAMLLRSAPSSI